jgi:hypothetical protein
MATHYELLGVPIDATPDEIREARRRLLTASHPDRASDSSDRERRETLSAAISAAAATLLDARTRRIYDRRIGVASRFAPVIPPEARRAVRGAAAPLLHTRAGQWGILLGTALLLGALATPPLLAGLVVGGLAVLIARPGAPTPLIDMEQMLGGLIRIVTGPGALLGRKAAAAAGASLRERVAEAGLGSTTVRGGLPRRPPVTGPGSDAARPTSGDEAD